jgi:predicted enzyme related to lactoylglutathione lyase
MSGKIVHFELPAQDTTRAKAFWNGVFEWGLGDSAMPGMEYYMVRTGEDQGGAVMKSDDRGMIVYFDTDDIEDTIARVRGNGGEAGEKLPIPGVGWFARCADSEGNDFSVFERDESVTG